MTTQPAEHADHRFLANGIELAVLRLPGRALAAIEIRVFAGCVHEDPACLGLAHVLAEAITKGTERRDGRALDDAFDQIGAHHAAGAGRETVTFSCICLAEFIEQAIDLQAEMIRTPTFPDHACRTAVELTRQALAALGDDPAELASKYLHKRAYGEPLGRHILGEPDTLERITRPYIVDHWQRFSRTDRIQVAVAGGVDPAAVADALERAFALPGQRPVSLEPPPSETARPVFRLDFTPARIHYPCELEQVQIGMCLPGAAATDDDRAAEDVLVGILSGGMSSRLWTALREKRGLVYWVAAWSDRPRGAGLLHLGAAATPASAGQACTAMLAELDRLADDCTDAEVQRAVTGLIASARTHGDTMRARAGRLANDLFHHGRPIPLEDQIARIEAVTVDDIRRYLATHSRRDMSLVTLGPGGEDDIITG